MQSSAYNVGMIALIWLKPLASVSISNLRKPKQYKPDREQAPYLVVFNKKLTDKFILDESLHIPEDLSVFDPGLLVEFGVFQFFDFDNVGLSLQTPDEYLSSQSNSQHGF